MSRGPETWPVAVALVLLFVVLTALVYFLT